MIVKFPQNIYFYNQQWCNENVLSEVANFDFDYLKAFGGEVHVWFSCFDSFYFHTDVGNFVAKHRPKKSKRHGDDQDYWSFFYDKKIDLDEYHKDTNYYLKHYRNYLMEHYKPEDTIDKNLVMIKSIRDILRFNGVQKYIFYKPMKQSFLATIGDEWFDRGHHYENLIKKHKLSYILKGEHWEHEFSAKKVFYD